MKTLLALLFSVNCFAGVITIIPGSGGGSGVTPNSCSAGQFANAIASNGTLTCATPAGSIGGSTGSTDNAILRADGTGGATVQSSSVTITDAGEVIGVAGSTTNAAYSTTGDANTGIYFPAADAVSHTAGGTEVARIGRISATYPTIFLNPGGAGGGISRIIFNGTTDGTAGDLVYRADLGEKPIIFYSGLGGNIQYNDKGVFANPASGDGYFSASVGVNVCGGGSAVANGTCGIKIASNGDFILLNSWTPSAANDACTAGKFGCDANYCYYCVASTNIKRTAIATWP